MVLHVCAGRADAQLQAAGPGRGQRYLILPVPLPKLSPAWGLARCECCTGSERAQGHPGAGSMLCFCSLAVVHLAEGRESGCSETSKCLCLRPCLLISQEDMLLALSSLILPLTGDCYKKKISFKRAFLKKGKAISLSHRNPA